MDNYEEHIEENDESIYIIGNIERMREGEDAVLINLNTESVKKTIFGGTAKQEDKVWIPKSQITNLSELKEGYIEVEIGITRWIAERKNLI